jgi:hypothetical protein
MITASKRSPSTTLIGVTAILAAGLATAALADPPPNCPNAGWVLSESEISQDTGGFGGQLHYYDYFGTDVAEIGDLDGDGVTELAIGAPGDDDGGASRGAVWILFLNSNGTVKGYQKISSTAGGFGGQLDAEDVFGDAVAALGDLDGDGIADLAVGAWGDDDGGTNRGAVWILFLNSNGTVKSYQKISATAGGFGGQLDDHDGFGNAVEALGDLDGDGVTELAVGANLDDDGGTDHGAVWILFLNPNGTVKGYQKISSTAGGFSGQLDNGDQFGISVAALGDLDGDGVRDLAVGAVTDDDGGTDRGAVWILFLNSNGTVKAYQKVSSTSGGFSGQLDNGDAFGGAAAALGDLDHDGVSDLAVGAARDDDGGLDRGAVWILFLNSNGTVRGYQKISATAGGFSGQLGDADHIGTSVSALGDLDGDGVVDLVTGADGHPGVADYGAVWLLSLDGCIAAPTILANPTSDLLPAAGSLTTFSITAEGPGSLSYQWRRDGVNLVDDSHISGATTPQLTILAGFHDIGMYDCAVTNGGGQVATQPAVLGIRTSCPGDINQDGVIDFADINPFVALLTQGALCY